MLERNQSEDGGERVHESDQGSLADQITRERKLDANDTLVVEQTEECVVGAEDEWTVAVNDRLMI